MSFLKRVFGARKKQGEGQQTGPETTVIVMPSGDAHTVPVPLQQIVTLDRNGMIVPLGQAQQSPGMQPPFPGMTPPGLPPGMPPGLPSGMPLSGVEVRQRDSKIKSTARRILRG